MGFCFPEDCKIVNLYQGAANAVACDVISCKNAHRVWFVINHRGSNDTDLTLTLTEYTAVGGSSSTVTATVPIWSDTDSGTSSDLLVRQTDAASWVIDPATVGDQLTVIQWDPSLHTDGYDCITLADSGGHASNTISIIAVTDPRQKADQPLSVIVD